MSTRIYHPAPLIEGARISLSEPASRHLGLVLRKNLGDPVEIFDGQGHRCQAHITFIKRQQVEVELKTPYAGLASSPLNIHLGQVMSKGERMDYVVQKATELGVTQITPLTSERCEVRLKNDREQRKIDHWQHVAISACEQSGSDFVPQLAPICKLSDWLAQDFTGLRLVLAPQAEQALTALTQTKPPTQVQVLIGPEGGLSESELDAAKAAGFQALQLGPRVLRTETAPVVALSLLQYLWGDF
ncbi:16S rRNA (uracil1498-N3)-methyltransferase [Allopseudospirillum japonicum]|uniref:Ribosomal RNA small subunit methyltransferase E n=1 Tax=Allopseudospirillum japonicum TaxID=64971 RepID=A0A1H6TNZ5_9GAMM|nr:16S rRNA (uracil(1498)-N(3))-methyltransferase [Allopseudospirillum japonicum]SEI81809.1 16S rRNA (uracil1498-N3)-methyltransferase [Allopseudospirillum japonicum]